MRRIQPLAPSLRLQAVHHDVTGDNVVSRPDLYGRPVPDGVIDFAAVLACVDELRNTVVSAVRGRPVFVRDVADVADGDAEPTAYVTFQSKTSGAVVQMSVKLQFGWMPSRRPGYMLATMYW